MDKMRIWRVLLVLFLLICISSARPSAEFNNYDVLAKLENIDDDLVEVWKQPVQPLEPLEYKRDVEQGAHRKRGFSMLARWKPFNSLARQRTSIRNINKMNKQMFSNQLNEYGELVSAETRAFSRHSPSGQPLRWG